ncbi:hypothetical protein BAU15_04710 [Enterococcus sp. JM4C]|uniref:baeRF6 domain-containing protein n=1 Tax=Candidatus Enterococcus huntleyi TaxID=1857217 RepID=UPI001379BB95|nr:hypothetical protein [Enterococcus sp. JM4C]KAF1295840.1 hypothetical protein BAU15_04710 [Enterococcus sp. JM4C]
MTEIGKKLLSQLTAADATGPFVTIMLNTHVAHQEVEKDQIKLKNFAKEAKRRFEKKYVGHDWLAFQEKIDALLSSKEFWRTNATSVAIILTEQETYIHRLSIRVDDQYYVSDTPYILAIIKNAQFNYSYYLLGLNRDSIKLYHVDNKQINAVSLPEDAPVDLVTALGDELTNTGSTSGKDGQAVHGINTKDEEVEIDWLNYYQAVDTFFKDSFENAGNLPIYLYALPENQTLFKKVAKNPYYQSDIAISASPSQLTTTEIQTAVEKINSELTKKEIASYEPLMNKKFLDSLVDLVPAAKDGKLSHAFIATSNLADGFGEDPETEYDRRQVLNTLADDVLQNSGQVFVLDQKDAPDEKSLLGILRY